MTLTLGDLMDKSLLLTLLSFVWAGYQILHAQKLYKHTQDKGEKFDMRV